MKKYLVLAMATSTMALCSCSHVKVVSPEELKSARIILQQGNNHQAYKMLCEMVNKYKLDYELVSLHVQAAIAVNDLEGLRDFYDGDKEFDLYGQGMWQAAVSDYDSSMVAFQKALLINPTENELYYRLGVVQVEAGHSEAALKSFQQAEYYGCKNPKLEIRRAMAYVGLQEYDKAMEALLKGIKSSLSREDLQNYIEYADVIVSKRRRITKREMESILPVINELNKNNVSAEEALYPLQNLLQRFPESSLLYAALGLYYFRNFEDGKGVDAINKAISIDSNDPYPPMVLGEYLLEGKNGQAALPYLQQAHKANPLDSRIAADLLECARIIDDKAIERDMLVLLNYLDPLAVQYISQIANYYLSDGKLDLAVNYYLKVLQQDKKNLPALYGLASIYWEQARLVKNASEQKSKIKQANGYLDTLLQYAPDHPQGNALKKNIDNFQIR